MAFTGLPSLVSDVDSRLAVFLSNVNRSGWHNHEGTKARRREVGAQETVCHVPMFFNASRTLNRLSRALLRVT